MWWWIISPFYDFCCFRCVSHCMSPLRWLYINYSFFLHLLLIIVVLVVGTTSPLQEKPKTPSFQIGSGWNFAGLLFKLMCIYTSINGVRFFRYTFKMAGLRSLLHLLLCTSVRRLSFSPLISCDVIGVLYALQFLIHSTFVFLLLQTADTRMLKVLI